MYGWLLENVSFSLETGRVWLFVTGMLTIALIGLIAARLYGRYAGFGSALFAGFSNQYLPRQRFLANRDLPMAAMLVTYCAIQARYVTNLRGRYFLHFLTGLLAVLAMEIHAPGIVLAIGMSIFYVIEYALSVIRERHWTNPLNVVWFGLGAAVGSGLYFIFNILPVGGLSNYVNGLIAARGDLSRSLFPGLSFETILMAAAVAYILWRRRQADKLLLGITISIIVPTMLLAAWYHDILFPFYAIPVGAIFADFFLSGTQKPGTERRFTLAVSALLIVLGIQLLPLLADGTNWLLQGQLPPFFYTEIRQPLTPYVETDDLIAGTHSLIWTFPDHRNMVSFASEYLAMHKWGYTDPVQVWERVKPTVIIDVVGQMVFPQGLQTYMKDHNFVECADFEQYQYPVHVYRQVCPATS